MSATEGMAEPLVCVAVSHPNPETLVRFAAGKSRQKEAREVVRHLLRGCRACSVLLAGQVSIPVDQDIYEPIFRRALKKPAEVAR